MPRIGRVAGVSGAVSAMCISKLLLGARDQETAAQTISNQPAKALQKLLASGRIGE